MQTAREHPRQSGAIGPSDPPAESFIPQTGGPGNASFSFVSLATAASFGFGLRTILLDHDRGNDAGMSRSVPRADRDGVAPVPLYSRGTPALRQNCPARRDRDDPAEAQYWTLAIQNLYPTRPTKPDAHPINPVSRPKTPTPRLKRAICIET